MCFPLLLNPPVGPQISWGSKTLRYSKKVLEEFYLLIVGNLLRCLAEAEADIPWRIWELKTGSK